MSVEEKIKHALPFEEKYSYQRALHYYHRHQAKPYRRLATWLERRMLAKALELAGSPKVVLDLPCGAGRFLSTILAAGAHHILAADLSEGMLQVAKEKSSPKVLAHTDFLKSNAGAIDLPDKSVDSICCMRLLHHIGIADYRATIYKELARVARETVCVSTWVNGNYRNYRSSKKTKHITQHATQINRHCFDAELQEQEFINAGFKMIGYVDMLKYYMPWRTYVLAVA